MYHTPGAPSPGPGFNCPGSECVRGTKPPKCAGGARPRVHAISAWEKTPCLQREIQFLRGDGNICRSGMEVGGKITLQLSIVFFRMHFKFWKIRPCHSKKKE